MSGAVSRRAVTPALHRCAVVLAVLAGLAALTLSTSSLAAAAIAKHKPAASPSAYPPSSAYPPGSATDGITTSRACTVSTTTVHAGPGDMVTLVGSGFARHTSVTLSIPSRSAAIGSVTTSSTGTFSYAFTWPASVDARSAVVQASAADESCSFTLVNAKASKAGDDGLSSTGFATLSATVVALALIGAGALFLGLARRRS